MTNHPHRIILLTKTSAYRAGPFTEAAKRLNIEVVHGIDMVTELAEYWQVPLGIQFNDPEQAVAQIVEFAAQNPVQAIISVDDSASLIAARASDALRLPHNSARSALAARNKYEMRRTLATAGIPGPEFSLYAIDDDPAEIGAALNYPCVLKPIILSGSRGVIRANNPAEFTFAFQRVAGMLRQMERSPGAEQIMVESYIPGVEVALEGILDRGKLRLLALFDKPDPLEGPFFEETIYVTPSRLPPQVQDNITDCTSQVVAALGLYHGPIHAELRVNDDGPWILEIAGRSIGGLCSKTLHFSGDISLEELILRQATGEDIELLTRQERAEGVMMIPIPAAGILQEVKGVSAAKKTPGVTGVEITAPLNHPLLPLPEGESYLGFIFAQSEKPEMVERALRQAHKKLKFDIAPMLPLMAVMKTQ